jgi:multidrug efflux system membrane fusion protein
MGQQTVIAGGLQPGETVVTDGQVRLQPGAKVQIKSGSAAQASGVNTNYNGD